MRPIANRMKASLFYLGLLIFAIGVAVYAHWIEPVWIQVTHHTVRARVGVPLKIAHLTDLHIDEVGYREKHLLDLLRQEKPDAILIVVGALLARLTVLLALSLPLFRMSGFSGWSILALQLHFLLGSESMGDHDSEVMDGGSIDRGDAGAMGVVAARRKGAYAFSVHAGADCRVSRAFS